MESAWRQVRLAAENDVHVSSVPSKCYQSPNKPFKTKVSENMLYICFSIEWVLDTTENGITCFLTFLFFFKYYCYDLAFNKSSYERTPNKVAVNSGLVWCIFGCKVTLTPCPSTFDPQKSNLFDECEFSMLSSSMVHYLGPGTLQHGTVGQAWAQAQSRNRDMN